MSLSILCQLLDLFVSFATASPKPMIISFNRLLWNVKDFLLSFLWHVSFFLLMSKTEIFGDNVTSSNRQIIVFILMVSHVTHFAIEEWWGYKRRLCICKYDIWPLSWLSFRNRDGDEMCRLLFQFLFLSFFLLFIFRI